MELEVALAVDPLFEDEVTFDGNRTANNQTGVLSFEPLLDWESAKGIKQE